MRYVVMVIFLSVLCAHSYAKDHQGTWTITVFKPSLKKDCSKVAALEMALDDQMIVTDVRIQGSNVHLLTAHNIKVIDAALKFEGIDTGFEEILEDAVIINECEN